MKAILFSIFLMALYACIVCCSYVRKNNQNSNKDFSSEKSKINFGDIAKLKENAHQIIPRLNDSLKDRLKKVRENFKRINSFTSWTNIDTKELWESSEGGEVKFYYQNKELEKIVTKHFGETFQMLTEYYLLNRNISFVSRKTFSYNRPLFYDSTAMKANNDTEAFDLKKSKIIEERSYFENGKLFYKINTPENSESTSKDYLKNEEKRITSDFDKLIILSKEK